MAEAEPGEDKEAGWKFGGSWGERGKCVGRKHLSRAWTACCNRSSVPSATGLLNRPASNNLQIIIAASTTHSSYVAHKAGLCAFGLTVAVYEVDLASPEPCQTGTQVCRERMDGPVVHHFAQHQRCFNKKWQLPDPTM